MDLPRAEAGDSISAVEFAKHEPPSVSAPSDCDVAAAGAKRRWNVLRLQHAPFHGKIRFFRDRFQSLLAARGLLRGKTVLRNQPSETPFMNDDVVPQGGNRIQMRARGRRRDRIVAEKAACGRETRKHACGKANDGARKRSCGARR